MSDDKWLGFHALDGSNEEWSHYYIWRSIDGKYYWSYFTERDETYGDANGPFDTAADAHTDAEKYNG